MTLGDVAFWSAVTSPVWGSFAWHTWQLSIRPRLVPRDEIKHMAEVLIAQYSNEALDIVAINEDRAWRRGETFEQGMWRQVGLELQRRGYTISE